jgi:hypothetical protein
MAMETDSGNKPPGRSLYPSSISGSRASRTKAIVAAQVAIVERACPDSGGRHSPVRWLLCCQRMVTIAASAASPGSAKRRVLPAIGRLI